MQNESKKLELSDKLDQFKKDICVDADAMIDQRDKANEDMRFVNVDGGQWEGFLEGTIGELYEKRAKLEFDTVSDYKNRFMGEWNQNRVGVVFEPDDDSTSDDDAELLNGIYRADFRQFSGKQAIDNAVDEVATCGYGAFKITSQYEDDEDPENELQRTCFEPVYNAFNSVFFDIAAKRADKRDARRVTELVSYTKESFKEEYPDNDPVSAYVPQNREVYNVNNKDVIYVARRYEIIKKKEPVFIYANLSTNETEIFNKEDHELIKDELKKNPAYKFKRERKIMKRHVEMSVFTGLEFLEEPRRISGEWLPIIPVYGYRAFVDGVEWYRGLVRRLKDAARVFNVQMNQLLEDSASNSQRVPIFLRQQVESKAVRDNLAEGNNKAFQVIDPVLNEAGDIVASGPVGYMEPPQINSAMSSLIEVTRQYIQQITGGAPQDTVDPDASGKAIQALLKRENLNTQPVMDNIMCSIEWSGEVWLSKAQEIYSKPRMINTISEDGTKGRDTLFKAIIDEKTGKIVEGNKLNGRKFRAFADIGPQYQTQREQTVEDLKGMLELLSQTPAGQKYTPAVISTLLQNAQGIGLGPIKKLVRQDMLLQGLIEPESDADFEFLQAAQQPKEDPQQKLLEAAAMQQMAESRSLDASSLQKTADAEKKNAETAQIMSEIETNQVKTLLDVRKQTLEQASSGFTVH